MPPWRSSVPEAIVLNIPRETVNDETVRILSWKTPSGSRVEKDRLVCEVETSKAVMEMHAPAAGTIRYGFPAGAEVAVGAICEIVVNGDAAGTVPAREETVSAAQPAPNPAGPPLRPARLTPLARRLAEDHHLEIASFHPGTLVRKDDVLRRL